jgi:hypothetical protein
LGRRFAKRETILAVFAGFSKGVMGVLRISITTQIEKFRHGQALDLAIQLPWSDSGWPPQGRP